MDMINGRLDVQIGDMLPMMDWLSKDGAKCCELVGAPIADPKFIGEGAGIAVRKEDTELLGKLNAAIDAIRANGKYAEINKKYFPIDIFEMK